MNFIPGMRVVLVEGDWESGPRTAGHYGKVTEVGDWPTGNDDPNIRVEIMGHIDGQPPMDLANRDMFWFYPEELTVVD